MSLSPATTKRHYVEVTPHTLHAVRTAGRAVEFCGECLLTENEPLQAFLKEWSEGAAVSAFAAVAPESVCWHLSTPEQARRLRSDADVRRFATRLPHGFPLPLEVIGCQAGDGMPVAPQGDAWWLLGVTPGSALAAAAALAIERGVVTAALGSGVLGRIGATVAALRLAGGGAVVLWDPGPRRSHVFTISVHGVEGVAVCEAGFDTLLAAVRQVYGLSSLAAAARRFFGESAEPSQAARIAAELAPVVDAALGDAAEGLEPVSFACTGLTAGQAWFAREMARALDLAEWAPDVEQVFEHLQLSRAVAFESGLSPELLGLLHLAAADAHHSPAWHPVWGAVSRHAAAPMLTAEDGGRVHHVVWPPPVPSTGAASQRVKRESAGETPTPVARRSPAAENGGSVPLSGIPLTARPALVGAALPAGVPAREPVAAATGGGTNPPPRKRVRPAGGPPSEPVVLILRKRGYWPYLALVFALVGAGAAGKFYLDGKAVKAAAAQQVLVADREKSVALEERARAVQEKSAAEEQLRLAAEQARALAQVNAAELERVRREAEEAQAAAVAQARREAGELARREPAGDAAAAPVADAPGILKIATLPPGAEISVDGGPPRRAPVAVQDLPPGQHRVRIALAGHVPRELSIIVDRGRTTDLGVIALARATGSAAVASVPAGLDFSIRTAGTRPEADPLRRGRTPALIDDLPTGDYVVQFSRAGWPERTERVTVERGATARATATFEPGSVTITSVPAGATVTQGDAVVGVTPLTLTGVPPRELSYELSVDGFEPLVVGGEVTAGRELRLSGELLRADRVASADEVRTPPRPFITAAPQLRRLPRSAPEEVTVSFIVGRDGSLRDVEVVDKVDRTIARRCVEAVSQWKFYPGISHGGHPVNVRMSVPVKLTGS